MSDFDSFSGKPLGTGQVTGPGALRDTELMSLLSNYKRSVASNYRAITSEDISEMLPAGKLMVSPKIDGELWYLGDPPGEKKPSMVRFTCAPIEQPPRRA